jgi:hypothetical protein
MKRARNATRTRHPVRRASSDRARRGAATVAALGLTGCGTAAIDEERSTTSNQPRSVDPSEVGAHSVATRSKADVGLCGQSESQPRRSTVQGFFHIELDRERGRLLWELDAASAGKAYDVKIHARSGKVVRLRRDRTPDPGMRHLKVARVTAAKAARTAVAAVRRADLHTLESSTLGATWPSGRRNS